MILTHRRIRISTPPHAEPLRPRLTHGSDFRPSGSTALTTAIESKVGEREDIAPCALRATIIFRPEDCSWKVAHRPADPLSTFRPQASYEVQ